MSKQYLTLHTIDDVQPADIFGLAATSSQLFVASGASSIKIYSTADQDYPLQQTIEKAHAVGCHHISVSKDERRLASVGFDGLVKIWIKSPDQEPISWVEEGSLQDDKKLGEAWAIALTDNGNFLVGSTIDGRINVWDVEHERKKIKEFETKGSFGLCIDCSPDGTLTASGHASGAIYVFNNETGRLLHSLPGLTKPVRAVTFSPGSSLLAAAGDSLVIGLYDSKSGENIANLTGHTTFVCSLDWSHTGEYILSGSFDGQVKVWSIEQRRCVTTHSETEKTLWSVKWLPKTGKSEAFVTAGSNRSISFYREASGG